MSSSSTARRALLVTASLLAAAPGPGLAQACFRAQPAPACERFWITELTIERRDGTLYGRQPPDWVTFGSGALGGMTNVSPRWALGGALVLVTRGGEERVPDDDVRGGLGAVVRVRRWLGSAAGLDVSVGLWGLRGIRPTVEVGVEIGGLAGLTAGARGDRLWPRRGEAYVGVRFGSGAALAAGIVGLLRAFASIGGT